MSHNQGPSGARRFGYFLAILINTAMIYAANHLLDWDWVPFINEDFVLCLWAINLSLGASIFINFVFMFFDRKWFRSLMQAFSNVFAFLSGYIFLQVFPLDLSESLASAARLGIMIILGLIALGTLVELINAVRLYNREQS